MGRRRGWFGRSGGGMGDMLNDFGRRWGWNQSKPQGVKKKGKGPKQMQSRPVDPGQEAFCNDDISWMGDWVGANQMDVGANYSVNVSYDDDDDDLMTSMIDLTQDGTSNDVMFGSIRGDVVGIQHYNGTVNNGEMVKLEREPNNMYDRNAIRVVNMDNNQVGHIKRELAKPLAFILDNQLARVEGVVPNGNNGFKMPIELTLWGGVEKKNEALFVLRSHGFTPRENSGTASSNQASGSQDYSHVVSNRVFLSPSEVRNEMDKLFDSLEEGDKTTMAEPTQAIRTPLYPHQKQALNWMICKENNEALPPFWEKRGQRYYNSLTASTSQHRPSTVHGGILADDMGLGKTLEVISLILTNFHDGQPLAAPVAGRKRFGQQSNAKTKKKKSTKKSQASTSTSNKPVVETNQSDWDIFNHCLDNPENYVEDSDEEEERKAKNLKIFQSRVPKFVVKNFGSSSESEDLKKTGLKNQNGFGVNNKEETNVIKSARLRKRMIIESDEDSNSASLNPLCAKNQNPVITENRKVLSAADILFDFLKSDSSSSSDDVDLNSNNLDIESNDPPEIIDISDDSNESKKDNSHLQLVEYTRYPSVIHDLDFLTSDRRKVFPIISENSCAIPIIDQSTACVSELQTAESREVTLIRSEDLNTEIHKEVIVIPDESPPLKPMKIKKGRKGWKVYQNKVNQPDIKKSQSLPPLGCSGRPKRNKKKPTRYVDLNSDDSDTAMKPPAKRARHNSLPVTLEDEDPKPLITIPVKPIITIPVKPIISGASVDNISVIPVSIVPDFFFGKFPSTSGVGLASSSVQKLSTSAANQQQSSEPSCSTCERNITINSKISTMVNKSNSKKGKGKGKKQKMVEEFGVGAPALPSLPVDINDELHPPSSGDGKDGALVDSDDASDEDWLPDLAMEIPFNCNKAVVSNCDSTTGRTKSDKPRTTLIVCPLSVMNNWLSQLEEHVGDDVQLEIYTYYGTSRTRNTNVLESQDIVISTYGTIAADFKGRNPLRKVHWLRIILDEGHYIRNSNTLMAKSIIELKAERRWVLTGTPIQNSIKDLYSLVNFLNISPLTESSWWKRTIERPIAQGHESAIKRVRALMANIGLRRTKNQQVNGKPLVELPARNVFIETIKFTDEERQVYMAMQTEGKLIISRYFQQGTLLRNYTQVLVILLRLRQLCCHPLLCSKAASGVRQVMELLGIDIDDDGQPQGGDKDVINDETKKKLIDALLTLLKSGSDEECPICLESLRRPVITQCAHVYCRECIEEVIQKTNVEVASCPMCRGELKADKLIEIPEEKLQEPEVPIVTDENWQSSSKVDALMKSLVQQRIDDPTVKSIIVSQFTSLLTLIEVPLQLNGFKFARLDGKMTNKKRVDNIEEFMDPSPDSPTIFLLSLKAGGVGLNLTAASRVYLMDPAWNPAAEEQCFDRCHRLGQKRDVNITKFLVEDSVEERMLALQERKRALMQGAFGKKQTAEQRRTDRINEIKALLDL